MNISYAFYKLQFSGSSRIRQGALLKIIFSSGNIGFADCHPWPELGDLPLMDHLNGLKRGMITPLMQCALEFAQLDAEARAKNEKILSHQKIPRSHFLVTDILNISKNDVQQWIQKGYTHLKIKLGLQWDEEVKSLVSLFSPYTKFKLRLDFNEKMNFSSFKVFLHRIQSLKESIEFIEDPFPFHCEEWKGIQSEGWNLACDRQMAKGSFYPESARMLIVKPGLQSFKEWQQLRHQQCIVTSSLGHPIGQLAAAFVAAQIDPSGIHVHGLNSHLVYQPTIFSQQLNWHSPEFQIPGGIGFGFDEQLQKIKWIHL